MTIQWFPGHMAKARREIEQNLKHVDLVLELVDARAPKSSQNPMLQKIIKNKPKILILMKKDLADLTETTKWLHYFSEENIDCLAVDVNDVNDVQALIRHVEHSGRATIERHRQRGIQTRPIRALILGIPNVGKSTLINRLANRKITKIGDRPGITRHQQWIKVKNTFELLDTPGILWPKFDDQQVGLRLAAIGTIKDKLLSLQDIAAYVLQYLQKYYPNLLKDRYNLDESFTDMWDVFEHIGKKRGALESGGHVNFDKVAEFVLRDLRTGKLGKITLETCDPLEEE
ncbi:MAG TPA: ribosome biogenesis GTPase YlqF [Bacillota bacterium]|nr:ribosome biogenesis GTPase YlqF [Bacillota bacterium]